MNKNVIIASVLRTIGMLEVLKASPCDPDWYVCEAIGNIYPIIAWEGNIKNLNFAKNILEQATDINPKESILFLHRAAIDFSLGERLCAVRLLEESNLKEKSFSPLLHSDRYENQLIEARRFMTGGDWKSAVSSFRLAISWGNEKLLPVDLRDYYYSIARISLEQLMIDPKNQKMLFIAGKYFSLAGESQLAIRLLHQLLETSPVIGLDSSNIAWAHIYLGKSYESVGKYDLALDSYKQAIAIDSSVRQSFFYAINLLQNNREYDETNELKVRLNTLGPKYNIGLNDRFINILDEFQRFDGYQLVGFDFDEELLETANVVDILLWWDVDNVVESDSKAVNIRDYYLVLHQHVNLFPNGSFEWNYLQDATPLGFDREFYGASKDSFEITLVSRNGQETHAFLANNSKENRFIGIVSKAIPVNSDQPYLMAGYIWDEAYAANSIRSCWFDNEKQSFIHYLVKDISLRITETWTYYASIDYPYPGKYVNVCEVFAVNFDSVHKAMWDDLIFIPIDIPE